ncbi:DHA2 family lincomycin resistance protein-like MFS transporter [Paenibacillus eucommiae]|uniref:DHA2 family lincomycin resistance protein-like MFS transporter n=2 Tax=Paenibacillus eucommiae TaxID=1355755 RepID=A0ABS4J9Q8_9BACL|nr:MDR family MFS transporter [Paenibacillus eucommiae]MBP1996594.1 DHA2 family lincomycin resistance protein-like MFS transporter [Paenibacillus eucommiae]
MNTAGVAPGPQGKDLGNIKKLPIMISLIIGAFFSILNETLLNIAFPDLVVELGVTPSTIQWLSTGYMLLVGVLVPASALLVQWFTTRQMFLGAMFLFSLGTLVCAVAPGFSVLLIGRLLQAAGTGLMLPVLMNTILVLYPPDKRGAAMGTIGLVIMFAPAIGPTLSGLILDSLDWRWLFYMVLPFAIFAFFFAFIYLKNVSDITKPKVDVFSIVLSTLGFGGIVFGFSSAGEGHGGWSSPQVYVSLIVGAISLIWFVLRQIGSKSPMLDLRAFKSPMFSLTTLLLIIVMMTLFSTLLLLPFLLQGALLLTAFTTGLIMLPGGVLNGLLSPLTGKLFDKFGPRALVIPGAALLIVIMYLFTQVSLATTTGMFIALHISMMIAISMIMMPAQTNGLNQLPRKYYPHGTAILNTLQQVSGAIGVAFFISIMSSGQRVFLENSSDPTAPQQQAEALLAGVQKSFTVGLVFAVAGLVLALFMKRTKAPEE